MEFNNKVKNDMEKLIYIEIMEEDITLKEQEEIMDSEWYINWMKEYHE
ncbi:hypothetical protein [Clostridium sp.]|nr:hypothetical protein [Clostridium sp.]MCI9303549.1 hypothetical protein [Clostridium sp.]